MVDAGESVLDPPRVRGMAARPEQRARVAPRPPKPRVVVGPNERCNPELEAHRLARASGPLRRALARVAGKMVTTRGWERLGFARLADYAVERAGMSARQLRDLAQGDPAPAAQPRLEQAFLAGHLGWTQVRLVCRAARPQDECAWIALASRLTASDLAREVRKVDQRARDASAGLALADEPEERRAGVVVR